MDPAAGRSAGRLIEPRGIPLWAITRHADIMQVASQPQRFSTASGITLDMEASTLPQAAEMVVYLDPPRHGPVRQLATRKFSRMAVRPE